MSRERVVFGTALVRFIYKTTTIDHINRYD